MAVGEKNQEFYWVERKMFFLKTNNNKNNNKKKTVFAPHHLFSTPPVEIHPRLGAGQSRGT